MLIKNVKVIKITSIKIIINLRKYLFLELNDLNIIININYKFLDDRFLILLSFKSRNGHGQIFI